MNKRWWWLVPLVVVMAAAGYEKLATRSHVVKVVSLGRTPVLTERTHPAPETPARSILPRPSGGSPTREQPAVASPTTLALAPTEVVGPRAVSSSVVISRLKQNASLTDAESKRLAAVFALASNIQMGIDAEPSQEKRTELQQRLMDQIEVRLRLILRDDGRVNLAKQELAGLPRIESDG